MEDLSAKEARKVLKVSRREISSAIQKDKTMIPLLIRFAWHCSGTYDKLQGNGGSNGSTMRFAQERDDPENRGFERAVQLFEEIRSKVKIVSYADLFILGGYVAIEQSGGPKIPFSYGRKDFTEEDAMRIYGEKSSTEAEQEKVETMLENDIEKKSKGKFAKMGRTCPFGDGKYNPCGSRLPAADLGPNKDKMIEEDYDTLPMHVKEKSTIDMIRNTFDRMGFNDKETVALIILGHQFGSCHPSVSGYDGFWYGFAPNDWNIFNLNYSYLSLYTSKTLGSTTADKSAGSYKEVLTETGKRQYEQTYLGTKWMMLIADMCLWWDPEYQEIVKTYNQKRRSFTKQAVAAWKKLTELGCDGILKPEIS